MSEQKRVKLTHGTARVDENCSKETLTALDELSKIAYEMESEPLNIDSVILSAEKCTHLWNYENIAIKDKPRQRVRECFKCKLLEYV